MQMMEEDHSRHREELVWKLPAGVSCMSQRENQKTGVEG